MGSGREYSRDDGTRTWEALEEVVGGLESGKAVAFASGMAAIASVFDQLAAGAVVVLPDDCYQGVAGLAAAGAEKGRWSVQRVAVDDTGGWIRACGVADLIWLESLEPTANGSGPGGYLRSTTQARSDRSRGQHIRHAVEPAAT
jgi:cystathionine gamma-synthase